MGATPHTLRCPRCKKYREWNSTRDNYDTLSNKNLVPTGRRKVVKRTAAAVLNVFSVEMKHDGARPPHLPSVVLPGGGNNTLNVRLARFDAKNGVVLL